jgi:hypothetical protein
MRNPTTWMKNSAKKNRFWKKSRNLGIQNLNNLNKKFSGKHYQ